MTKLKINQSLISIISFRQTFLLQRMRDRQFSNSLIIHQAKTKEITTVNVILIIIKFCELLLRISPRIINSLRSYIKHSKECFLLFPNTSKLVKKTRLRLVFPTYFSVFGNRRKHSSSCLIYYFYSKS